MKRRALVIGINRYEDEGITPLEYAERDAWHVENLLRDQAGFEVESLTGSLATRKAINRTIRKLCTGLGPGDLFVLYFAGHGYEEDTTRGHLLLAWDVQQYELAGGLAADVIPVRGVEQVTGESGASRLLLLDACREALPRGARGTATLQEKTTRDLKTLAEVSRENAPLCVVCSCGARQKAHELAAIGGGVFTHSLVQVLRSRISDGRGVELPGDLEAVEERMREVLSAHGGGRQEPWYTVNRAARFVVVEGKDQPDVPTGRVKILREPMLRIVTVPSGASISVNGTVRGQAPLGLELRGDQYMVRAEKEGYEAWERRIRFDATGDAELLIELKEKRRVVEAWFPMTAQEAAEVQRASAESLGKALVQRVALGNGVDLEMVGIPPGEFLMGSPKDEKGRYDDEVQHKVRLTRGFWLGKYAVTQAEYEAVMGKNPSSFEGAKRPVECVSWHEAVAFCNALSEREGLTPCYSGSGDNITCNWGANGYRLPTEAEWEYACRAGTGTAFYTGECTAPTGKDPALDRAGWYDENSGNETHEVGRKEPNAWGLYDMHGNVWEWCWDWYGREYYSKSPPTDPVGPSGGSDRVYRGGCWYFYARSCRSAIRIRLDPGRRGSDLGFRLARG